MKKADLYDPDYDEGGNTVAEDEPNEGTDAQEIRDAAQKAGFKWQGLYDEDEDGKTYSMARTDGFNNGPGTVLYLKPDGQWYLDYEHANREDLTKFREGKDAASFAEALQQEVQAEEDATRDWEAEAVARERKDFQDSVDYYVEAVSEYLRGDGELEYGEAISEGGRDNAEDFISDVLRERFHIRDYELLSAVKSRLSWDFIEQIVDEDEYAARQERMEMKKIHPAAGPANLTDKEVNKIVEAARLTWDAIAYDTLRNIHRSSMSAEDVWEVVQDANHMESYGNLDDRLMQEFNNLSPTEREYVMQVAFPMGQNYGY